MRQPTEREQWFLDRIGKVVFRNKTSCECFMCASVYEKGMIVDDKLHASYIAELESISTYEGSPLRYFDTKEEALQFERSITEK